LTTTINGGGMFLFIIALIAYTVGIILLFMIVLEAILSKSFIACLKSKEVILILILGIVALFVAYGIGRSARQQIESNAIDHYIMGDVEKVEIFEDGEVIDWYYKVIDVDYD
jgi:hypothetical protein